MVERCGAASPDRPFVHHEAFSEGEGKIDVLGMNLANDPFIGLGGTVTFGAERGTTFDIRGIARKLPRL